MESFLIDAHRTREDLFSWVLEMGIDSVVDCLWDDEFFGQYDPEEIEKELKRILS